MNRAHWKFSLQQLLVIVTIVAFAVMLASHFWFTVAFVVCVWCLIDSTFPALLPLVRCWLRFRYWFPRTSTCGDTGEIAKDRSEFER